MTPSEKAKELIEKFKPHALANWENKNLKQCALIAVDEIILNNTILLESNLNNDFSILGNSGDWYKVKEEIQKL